MKEGVEFVYAGIKSTDMGLINVEVDTSGFFEEPFLAEREIMEVQIRGRDKPYFQGVKTSPLVFSLSFAFLYPYDEQKIREVARWLNQDYYQPFYTTANPNRIFYCMLHSDSRLLHNGLREGYVTIQMRCDSPYSYSPVYMSDIYDFSNNTDSGSPLTFENHGDVVCKPEMWIWKVGDDNGDIVIVNHTNGGQEFRFKTRAKARGTLRFTGSVSDGETIIIGGDVYEFNLSGGVTSGRIAVNLSGDGSADNAINKLVQAINTQGKEKVTAYGDTVNDTVTVVYNEYGSHGNISVGATTKNAYWDDITLTGGTDGLVDGEEVYVDNENEIIKTNLQDTYRYDVFNDNFLEMVRGVNRLTVYGKCKIQFRYQFKTLQG